MGKNDLPMADPTSALELDISESELSTEELMAKIDNLRGMRLSDLERLAAGRVKRSVNKSTDGEASKVQSRMTMVDELTEIMGKDNPLLAALLATKKPRKERKKKGAI